ncbi:hypothetical protein ACFVWG_17390 [Kribbella sp. NPDC058245]|uniref:hypothetical protein n=1 Tax=Kribbella sp. NPDC058245 TaxID=3346399 RepID=UPI0036EC14E5
MIRLSRLTLVALAGLLVGVAGLVIQWIADPGKFSEALPPLGVAFPPGIAFIVLAGVLAVLTSRWWWHPVFAVLIAFWIAGVGTLAGQLTPNLVSDNFGTVAGTSVMTAGLMATFIAGIRSAITARHTHRQPHREPGRVRHPA